MSLGDLVMEIVEKNKILCSLDLLFLSHQGKSKNHWVSKEMNINSQILHQHPGSSNTANLCFHTTPHTTCDKNFLTLTWRPKSAARGIAEEHWRS
jgi:hypothetical protein